MPRADPPRRRQRADEIWCVADVDEYDIGAAATAATRSGVELAVSNPCFEVWLLLHLCATTRQFADYRDVRKELNRVLPGYDKARLRFPDFSSGVGSAVTRARRLDEAAGAGTPPNPSSGVWRLVARIMGDDVR